MPLDVIGMLAGGALSAGVSALGQSLGLDKKKKALKDYVEQLQKMKYDSEDIAMGENDAARIGNSQTASALNQIAPGLAGSLNETQAKSALVAPIAAAGMQNMIAMRQKYLDYNKSLDEKAANASLGINSESMDYGDVLGSGLAGAMAYSEAAKSPTQYPGVADNKVDNGTDSDLLSKILDSLTTQPGADMNLNTPSFLNQPDLEEGMNSSIFNFLGPVNKYKEYV